MYDAIAIKPVKKLQFVITTSFFVYKSAENKKFRYFPVIALFTFHFNLNPAELCAFSSRVIINRDNV